MVGTGPSNRQNPAERGARRPAHAMHPPKAFVLRTAGTNCDGETVEALARAGARAELLHLERLVAEPARLDEAALVVLPGGFSYGDDVAAGRVFGLELRHLLHDALAAFVERGGFVLACATASRCWSRPGSSSPPARRARSR
jgi:phosphoribosylformylglycinamidine synthase